MFEESCCKYFVLEQKEFRNSYDFFLIIYFSLKRINYFLAFVHYIFIVAFFYLLKSLKFTVHLHDYIQ